MTIDPFPADRWAVARRLFVSGQILDDGTLAWPGTPEIAYLADVPADELHARAVAGGWDAHRDAERARLAERERQEAAQRAAEYGRRMDELAMKGAISGLEAVVGRIAWVQARAASFEAAEKAQPDHDQVVGLDELAVHPVDPQEMQRLSQALTGYQAAGEKVLGRAQQVEVSGVVAHVGIGERLLRDDPDRLTLLLDVLGRTRDNGRMREMLEIEGGDQ